MFRSAENLRLAADMRALQRVAAPWRKARSTWFDGTPESLEARLAATERVLTHARSGVTQAHIALEREASIARAELKEASHRLMVDFLDDGARAFKGSRRVAGADEDYAREEREFWNRHVKDTGPGVGDEDDDEPRPDDYPRHGSRRVAGMHDADPSAPWRNTMDDEPYSSLSETPDFEDLSLDGSYSGKHRSEDYLDHGMDDEHICDHCGLISPPEDVEEEGRCPDCGKATDDPHDPLPDYMQPGYRSPYRENNHGHWEDDLMEGGGPGAPQDGPGRHRSEATRVRRRAAPMASPGDGGSAIAPVEMGGGASASIPGAIGKMIWNGSTMTGQEPPAAFNAGPGVTPKMGYRSAAYDMVECSRCGKEIPDDGNQVVDTSTPGSYTHDKKGGTLEDFCPDCMPKKYKRRKSFDPPSVGGRNAAFLPDFDDSLLFGD